MKNRIFFVCVILVLGAGYAGYFIYDFRSEEVPKLEAELARLQTEANNKEGELRRLQAFRKNIDSIKLELKELNLQLTSALEYMPRTFELSKLLLKLTLLAQNSGVELFSFKPKKADDKKEAGFFNTVSIDFELKGSFTQTLVFLDQLSRLKRIINIESLKLSPPDAAGRKGSTVVATTAASIKTYRFVD